MNLQWLLCWSTCVCAKSLFPSCQRDASSSRLCGPDAGDTQKTAFDIEAQFVNFCELMKVRDGLAAFPLCTWNRNSKQEKIFLGAKKKGWKQRKTGNVSQANTHGSTTTLACEKTSPEKTFPQRKDSFMVPASAIHRNILWDLSFFGDWLFFRKRLSCTYMLQKTGGGGSRILVGGPAEFWPQGRAWAQNLLKIRGFPLKLPENCMILNNLGASGVLDPLVWTQVKTCRRCLLLLQEDWIKVLSPFLPD